MEQNLHQASSPFESDENLLEKQKNEKPPSDNTNASFDCNICLDSAHEPVITLCGHLYCWPCIYKWFHVDNKPKCPVCKSQISATSLVPLYGRGTSPEPDHKSPIPRRPPPAVVPRHHLNEPINSNGSSNYSFNFGNASMVFARMFGPNTGILHNPYNASSYPIRWQESQVNKSLNRVSIFLFCCFILCLLLF